MPGRRARRARPTAVARQSPRTACPARPAPGWFATDCEQPAARRGPEQSARWSWISPRSGPGRSARTCFTCWVRGVVKVESSTRRGRRTREAARAFFDLLNRGKGEPHARSRHDERTHDRLQAAAPLRRISSSRRRGRGRSSSSASTRREFCANGRALTWISLTGHGARRARRATGSRSATTPGSPQALQP